MTTGRAAACAVAFLALLPAAAGCGKSKPTGQEVAAQARAAAQWKAGLTRWRKESLQALDGISVLLSTTSSLTGLEAARSRSSLRMTGFEQTLARCSATVEALGRVPDPLRPARRYALQACKSLERGEALIEQAVYGLRHGRAGDGLRNGLIDRATGPLSDGQNELTVVGSVLAVGPQ